VPTKCRSHNIRAEYFLPWIFPRPTAPQRLFEETRKRNFEIDLLINMPALAPMGDFASSISTRTQHDRLEHTFAGRINPSLLQPMREEKGGAIMNVCFDGRFQPVALMATYAATKAFVLSFSEALWEENRTYGESKWMALLSRRHGDKVFRSIEYAATAGAHFATIPNKSVEVGLRSLGARKSSDDFRLAIVCWWRRNECAAKFVLRTAGAVMRSHNEKG